ncbi:MAG: hypothetical protein ACYTGR_12060, partial [Planctomycetota bacterium]|jgi:hypothetical protein
VKRISVAAIAIMLCAGTVEAASLLVSQGVDGRFFERYYGGADWSNLTAEIDARFDSVTVAADFEDLGQMLTFDRLWLDQRWLSGSLSATELANLATFIATGRRVVMIGENDLWAGWNNQILGLVGGSYASQSSGTATALDVPPLTDGVTTIDLNGAGTAGIASGARALFDINWSTLWDDNVVTALDINAWRDSDWSGSNAQFGINVVEWLATPSPGACPADITGDGTVGLGDLLDLLAAWGSCSHCPEDINGDGEVDFQDLIVVLSDWGPCPQPGACCLGDGSCEQAILVSGFDCAAQGGIYHGDDTLCADVTCPQPGACCLLDGSCEQSSAGGFDCASQGGVYHGDETLCTDVICPQSGACCLPGGSCAIRLEDSCVADGGTYVGDGTQCAPVDCTQGACCFVGGSCLVTPPGVCEAVDGTYMGDGVTCDDVSCP